MHASETTCMRACAHTGIRLQQLTPTCKHAHAGTHTYSYVCNMQAFTCALSHTCIHMHRFAYINAHNTHGLNAHSCVSMHSRTHAPKCRHMLAHRASMQAPNHAHTHTQPSMQACTNGNAHARHVHAHACWCMCRHVLMRAHTCTHTYVHTCIRANVDTHGRVLRSCACAQVRGRPLAEPRPFGKRRPL